MCHGGRTIRRRTGPPRRFPPATPRGCARVSPRISSHFPLSSGYRAVAESPCARMRRRRNPAAGGGFRGRIRPHLRAFPLENLRKFIEKPREFTGIYRYFRKFHILEQADRLHHHTGIPRIRADGNCGELRGRAQVEDEAGLPGEGSPQSEPTPQVTPERLTSCYRKCGEMRSRPDGGRSLSP